MSPDKMMVTVKTSTTLAAGWRAILAGDQRTDILGREWKVKRIAADRVAPSLTNVWLVTS